MTKTQVSIVLAGAGGQGVMFTGHLLCYAAMDEGYNVTWIPSYGPEMRGGTANCLVVISQRQIGSPVIRQVDMAVVFNLPSALKFVATVAPGGLAVINSSLIHQAILRTDIEKLVVPATDVASHLGDLHLTNMVLLGALLAARPILPLTAVRNALEKHLPEHHRNLLTLNLQALEAGTACIAEAR